MIPVALHAELQKASPAYVRDDFLCYGRTVEQAMAGAHVSGSPFRVVVVEGAVTANASLAYGVGIDSPLAGGMFGTSAFRIRQEKIINSTIWYIFVSHDCLWSRPAEFDSASC